MTPQIRTSKSAAGDGLMALIATAVIVVVIIEAVFVAYASWLLLPVIMFTVIAAAVIVVYGIVRVIDHDTPLPVTPPARPQPAPQRTPAPARVGGTALAGR
jgi:hypothetical protein